MELGLEYTHVPLTFDDPRLKQPDFLRINPAGAIPALVDDGFALGESLAINLYLAKKYGTAGATPLYPNTLEGEADVWRWSLWVQGHLEPWVQRDALLAGLRETSHHAQTAIDAAADRQWLAGDHFDVTDLNVAAVLSPSRAQSIDLRPYEHVGTWLARCYGRPAAVATRRRFQASFV